eukprot:SAG22_NODE_724_length_7634_cov_11.669808_4_plen_83_part_00
MIRLVVRLEVVDRPGPDVMTIGIAIARARAWNWLMLIVSNSPSRIAVMPPGCLPYPAELWWVALNSAPLWMISAIRKRNSDR